MKKILPVVIVIGVVSLVACAGLGSCETTVYADENNFVLEGHKAQAVTPSSNPYDDYPSLGGMFDYVANNPSDNTPSVYLVTGYFDLTAAQFANMSFPNNSNPNRYGLYIGNINLGFNTTTAHWGALNVYSSSGHVGYGYNDNWCPASCLGSWILNGPTLGFAFTDVSVAERDNLYASMLSAIQSAGSWRFQYWLDSPHAVIPYSEYVAYPPLKDIYADGYEDGYNYAVETLFDMKMGVYIQWNTNSNSNRTFTVEWFSGGQALGHQVLTYYNSTIYFERPMSSTYTFSITAGNGVPFSVTYSSVNYPNEFQTVTSDLAYGGVYYLPTWEGSITLTVNPDDIVTGWPSDYDFALDSSAYLHVNLSSTFAAGYRQGVLDGYADGYASGADDVRSLAYSMGRSDGYADGYDYGYRVGYNEGENAVSEGGLVVANLFGAVAGVPISILNGLSGLTIWSIPLISVLMSFMFLGIIIWVVKKFI